MSHSDSVLLCAETILFFPWAPLFCSLLVTNAWISACYKEGSQYFFFFFKWMNGQLNKRESRTPFKCSELNTSSNCCVSVLKLPSWGRNRICIPGWSQTLRSEAIMSSPGEKRGNTPAKDTLLAIILHSLLCRTLETKTSQQCAMGPCVAILQFSNNIFWSPLICIVLK